MIRLIRQRFWRRALVLLLAVVWVAIVVRLVVSPPTLLGFLVIAGGVFVVIAVLVVATRRVTASPDADIDERERAVRDRVHRLAFWSLNAPNGALLGYVMLVFWWRTDDGAVQVTGIEASVLPAVALTMVVLWTSLPELVMLWTEPDPPTEEDDHG